MKNIRTLAGLLAACALLLPARAALADSSFQGTCAAKEKALQSKLAEARKHNNQDQVRGLEEALFNVQRWCTDSDVLAKAELEVMDKSEELREREDDLAEALRSGKADKIAKREEKLEEARAELRRAEQKRDAARRAQGAN